MHFYFSKSISYLIVLSLFLLYPLRTSAQHTNPAPNLSAYEKDWQIVDSLALEGLQQSALKAVVKIYNKARKDGNTPQVIKAVLHRMAFQSYREEETFQEVILSLQKDVAETQTPVKQVLHSVLAEMYWRYYEHNRYKFYNRSTTVDYKNNDLSTWDLRKIVSEVIHQYSSSLQHEMVLQKLPIQPFEVILERGDSDAYRLRPTLYDFLAHRAIDFYKNEEADLIKPAFRFELDQPAYFSSPQVFSQLTFQTQDTFSLKFHALTLYRDVLAFHLKDTDPLALAEADLARLQFVHQYSVLPEKDTLFLSALTESVKAYANQPASAGYEYAMADFHAKKGVLYKPLESEVYKWEYTTALALCEQVRKQFPETQAAQNAQSLQLRLLEKSLSLTAERITTPLLPFRVLVTHKNVATVHFRLYPVAQQVKNSLLKILERIGSYDDQEAQKRQAQLQKLKPLRQWTTTLPDDGDLQTHSAELKVDGLPSGEYLLLAATDKNLVLEKNAIAHLFFNASQLAYISRYDEDNNLLALVTDRESGKPIAKATVEVYKETYNYQGNEKLLLKDTLQTNAQGVVTVPNKVKDYSENVMLRFSYQQDTLESDRYYLYKNYNTPNQHHTTTVFFTDRAIYRPGQTIHFKGLVLENDKDQTKIVPRQSVTVSLLDVNGKEVAKLNVTTNAYGTYSGVFTAPTTGLTGQMRIQDDFGSQVIQVEEYKRPTFEVNIEPQKGTYKPGDSVTVKGIGKTLSGTVVDGAKVSYRVVRQSQRPVWGRYKYWFEPSPETEITNGQTVANEKGEFEIKFTALPDQSISPGTHPIFVFTIFADVTDQNGETRSARQSVHIGYQALLIQTDLASPLNGEQAQALPIKITNLAGEPEQATGTVTVHQLQAPGRLFRKRLWPQADQHLMTQEAYYASFPYDPYADEDSVGNWPKGKQVMQQKIESGSLKDLTLTGITNWAPGEYVLEINVSNAKGEKVSLERHFTVYHPSKPTPALKQEDWVIVHKNSGEPGEKAVFLIGTGEESFVWMETEVKNKLVAQQWLQPGKEPLRVEIPIEAIRRGNFAVHFTRIQHGRTYTHTETITVPHTDKQLQVEFMTFRDKLLPGQSEEWKVRIKSALGEKVTAEMVATLYDASLNAFRPLQWPNQFYPYYTPIWSWDVSNASFSAELSQLTSKNWNEQAYFSSRHFFQLNWFGYQYFGNYNAGYYTYLEQIRYHKAQLALEQERKARTIALKKIIKASGRKITGIITEASTGKPLRGVSIFIKDTNISTTSGKNGTFSFNIPPTPTELFIYHSDYQAIVITVDKQTKLTIALEPGSNELNEIVVDGYGAQSKMNLAKIGLRQAAGSGMAAPVMASPSMDDTKSKRGGEMLKESSLAALAPKKAAALQKPGQALADEDFSSVQVRRNFNETAFFYPHLETDNKGEIAISFTIPEALTRWKFMAFAHTQAFKTGSLEKEIITQKNLMITANAPRFLREGDQLIFTAKLSNLAGKSLKGKAELQLFDALTMQPLNDQLGNTSPTRSFTVNADQSTGFNWALRIPTGVQAVTYRLVAKSGNFTDGEEKPIPVLTNRMLVTETMPVWIRGKGTRTFELPKLLNASLVFKEVNNAKSTLQHERLTFEFTSNPVWYAVQALPYLMEYPYECTEQLFSRFYANSLATHLAQSQPRIKAVFDSWKRVGENQNKETLLSNLEKNQELKSLLLEETPWVAQARNEAEDKQHLALLFDLNRMSQEQSTAFSKLLKLQLSSGAFSWFPGMKDDSYITTHIIGGLGHMKRLGIRLEANQEQQMQTMLTKAVRYLDNKMRETYQELKKNKADLTKNQLYGYQIQYLYARSFFPELEMEIENKEAFEFYKKQAQQYWLEQGLYQQGTVALTLHRMNDKGTPAKILQSLREKARESEELGMYWPGNTSGFYWYQAPIETQALLIEAFDEITHDTEAVEAMKTWLLKNKQTNAWKTTKATTEACYALLLRGNDWLSDNTPVAIKVGTQSLDLKQQDATQPEAGTGYFKKTWTRTEVKPEMGKITLQQESNGSAWGALYWQYFEQLDKITPSATPLSLRKSLFLQKNSPTGPVITPVAESTTLQPGDLIKVRIELRSDRAMEYIHLKDMWASGLEPVNVLSQYKYQDGLGYYESTRDAATNFFISYLPKGTFVFEYDLRVTHEGNFSNGITTIQCMYAPEFTSHSEGIRVQVK